MKRRDFFKFAWKAVVATGLAAIIGLPDIKEDKTDAFAEPSFVSSFPMSESLLGDCFIDDPVYFGVDTTTKDNWSTITITTEVLKDGTWEKVVINATP